MKITKEQLNAFQQLYKQQFGVDIDDEAAYDAAIKLLSLMKLVYQPIRASDLRKAEQRRKELGM